MVKDYGGEILYHPCKVNVVIDTLSWKWTSGALHELCLRMKTFTPLLELLEKRTRSDVFGRERQLQEIFRRDLNC